MSTIDLGTALGRSQEILRVAMDEHGLKARYVALQDALDVMPASQGEATLVLLKLLKRTLHEMDDEQLRGAHEMLDDRHCEERVTEHEAKIGKLED